MNSFDRFYGIILFFSALLIAFLPVILITLEEYKFKAMLKKISFTQPLYYYI